MELNDLMQFQKELNISINKFGKKILLLNQFKGAVAFI